MADNQVTQPEPPAGFTDDAPQQVTAAAQPEPPPGFTDDAPQKPKLPGMDRPLVGSNWDKPIIKFSGAENLVGADHPIVRGVVKGGEDFASGFTAPGQIGLMAAIPGSAALGKTFSRLVSGGFSLSILWGAMKQSPQLLHQIKTGDAEGAAQTATSMGLGTVMAGMSGTHAIRGEKAPVPPAADVQPPAAPVPPSAALPTAAQAWDITGANARTIVAAMMPEQPPPAPAAIPTQPQAAVQAAPAAAPPSQAAIPETPIQEETLPNHATTVEQSGQEPVQARQPEASQENPAPAASGNGPVIATQPGVEPSAPADAQGPLLESPKPAVQEAQPEPQPEPPAGFTVDTAPEPKKPVTPQIPSPEGTKYVLPGFATGQQTKTPKPKAPKPAPAETAIAAPPGGPATETPIKLASPTETATQTGAPALVEAVYQKLKAGESLGNVVELSKMATRAFGSSRTSGEWDPKDMFDAMEAGINKHLLDRGKDLLAMDPHKALGELRDLMGRVTTQGVRTDEQIKNQQFSTPPTESYVAARVAALKPDDVVLEPSAGNGGLAVWPKSIGAETHVNEISKRRGEMLQAAGIGKPTTHDGELINALLDPKVKPSVILMNPPFSASTTKTHEAKNSNVYGYNHVDQALQRLAPGGRLVAILGGGQANEPNGGAALNGGQSGKWFDKVGKQYNIRANVRVNGKEYQKYGTNFATRIIVIDKSGPNPGWRGSVVAKNVDTLEEAYNALKDVEASRPALASGPSTGVPARPGSKVDAGTGKSGPRVVTSPGPGTASNPAVPETSGGIATGGKLPSEPRQPERELGNDKPEPGDKPPVRVESQPAAAQPESNPEAQPPNGPESSVPLADDERAVGEASDRADRVEEDDKSAYVTYQPSIKGKEHPGAIVETKTMATVPLPPITYKTALPAAALENGWLSAVQLEAIAVAGQQNDITLPGGFRASALIGDGTGVGKGSEAAGIMWDNYRKGRKRLVMVSQNWDLMQAFMGDLNDVGAAGELLRGIKRQPNGKWVQGKDSGVRALTDWKYGQKIEHDGVVFATYGTVRAVDKKGNQRVGQLEEYLKGDDGGDGGYILFDESHNLKNAVPGPQGKASKIGEAVKGLMERIPGLRSVSLSATAASDVGNLGYLDRLGLWGPGTPFPVGFRQFQSEVAAGGMAAMELIARELKAQGKYISRTLSFKGVTYETEKHELTEDQKEIYRTASRAWASVTQAAEATIKTTNGGGMQKGRFMAQFYGAQLRFFSILITTLKIPTAVRLANEAVEDGKAVVITLVNTNEAAQNREKNKAVEAGDDEEDLSEYDFGPKEILLNLIRENYPTQQYVDDVDSNGNPTKRPLTRPNPTNPGGPEIAVQNPQAIEERDALIAQIDRDLHLPDNPLDILINALGGHNKVAELTGRKEYFDRATNKFISRGGEGTPQKEVNLQEARNFQDGKKEVAVLSGAAGTGISLHAGLNVRNQKQRVQITLQVGWQADRAQQMLGRTHRTNQASAPQYKFLVSDLGGEQRFVATIQQRLESLGALSKGQKDATSGTGTAEFNPLSEQGKQAANGFYVALLKDQPVPGTGRTGLEVLTALRVLKSEGGGGPTVPMADRQDVPRLLNRILALDPDLQNAVFTYYGEFFDAAMKQAIEDGSVDTGVKKMPGDEFTIGKPQSLAKDPATGAETMYYPVEAREKRKRISPTELDKQLRKLKDDNPRIFRNNKNGKLFLVIDAQPRVTMDGAIIPSYRVASAGNGDWVKLSQTEVNDKTTEVKTWANMQVADALAKSENLKRSIYGPESAYTKERLATYETEFKAAQLIAEDPMAWAKARWKEDYDAAPSHITIEHHLIGGAVMKYWNAIKESTSIRHSIFTTVDSKTGQRVVGIDIPPARIKDLIARITGGASMVDASQLYADVLKNGMSYTLEGNIQVRQGRVGREKVIQLMPPAGDVATNLVTLGAKHERGVVPIYYIPTGKEDFTILGRILDTYPVKSDKPAPRNPESGAATLNVMSLGLASFIADDVAPTVTKAAQGLAEAADDILKVLAPTLRSPDAKRAGLSLRHRAAELARNWDQVMTALATAKKYFDQVDPLDSYDFIAKMEDGKPQGDPDLDVIANALRTILDDRRDQVQALGTGKLKSFYEDYFPHIWQDPKKAAGIFATLMGRRPIEGGKAFLKKRSLITFEDGLQAGLKPVTDNPVELVLLKTREIDRYVMAHRLLNEWKGTGLAKFYKPTKKAPAGWSKIVDPIGIVWGGVNNQGAMLLRGNYWAPEGAARILDNYLSPGLQSKSGVYRALLGANNVLNQAQLGLSAFHLGFTSADASISKGALAIEQLLRGRPLAGLKTAAGVPFAPVTTFLRGNKLLKEWHAAGSQGPQISEMADALVMGGGRAHMDQMYATNIAANMKKAFRTGNVLGGLLRSPFAGVEALSNVIMKEVVPRQKLGVFADLAKFELERLGPNATEEQVRTSMGQIWDSVENRMGQMTYDNLFWNRIAKDLAMLNVRSVGWNLGTIREIGGAAIDTVRIPVQLARGKSYEKVNLHRVAYVVSLAITSAIMGALYQYLATGKGPQELKDYFFPQNGELDEAGRPQRVAMPTYVKDVYHYATEPGTTLLNKISPLDTLMAEMVRNEDYYHTAIRNEDDPLIQQMIEAGKHVASAYVPFGVRTLQRETSLNAPMAQKTQQFFGLTPAPSALAKSSAELLAGKLSAAAAPPGTHTKLEAERRNEESMIRRLARLGRPTGPEIGKALHAGTVTVREARQAIAQAHMDPLMREFHGMSLENALKVWTAATPEERRKLRPMLLQKGKTLATKSPAERAALLPKFVTALKLSN